MVAGCRHRRPQNCLVRIVMMNSCTSCMKLMMMMAFKFLTAPLITLLHLLPLVDDMVDQVYMLHYVQGRYFFLVYAFSPT